VDVGKHRRLVPVSGDQRWAVYQISPDAAQLAGWLEGPPGWAWFAFSCSYQICDDYSGAYFIWALRGAAADTGHMDTAGEAQRFFGRIADDIEAACREDFPCSPPGVGLLPPFYEFNVDDVTGAAWDASVYFLTLDFASPERPSPSTGTDEQWATATRALRGVDRDREAYLAVEHRALDDQWPVTALAWLYRWGGRLGGVVALVGLAVGAVTRAGRRRGPVASAAVAMLAAVAGRIVFVALLDASAYPAARYGAYLLPGVGFYVLFVTFGSWVLMMVARDWWRARHDAGAAPTPAPAPEAAGDAGDDTAAPERRQDTTLVGQ
jgi:hypothetical protein